MLKGKGIISDLQRSILILLQDISDFSHFYLTGGTALAEFYLAHRRSYDLDIFTAEEGLVLPVSRLLEEELKRKRFCIKVIRRFSSFVDLEISQDDEITKVQLAFDSPFRFEKPLISDLGIKVNDFKDIIVDKLIAFFGRAEPRDAVDLFFILEQENIWDMTRLAAKKDPGFDLYWLAVALEKVKDFPDDIARWPVDMLIKAEPKRIKDIFSHFSLEIMKKIEEGESH